MSTFIRQRQIYNQTAPSHTLPDRPKLNQRARDKTTADLLFTLPCIYWFANIICSVQGTGNLGYCIPRVSNLKIYYSAYCLKSLMTNKRTGLIFAIVSACGLHFQPFRPRLHPGYYSVALWALQYVLQPWWCVTMMVKTRLYDVTALLRLKKCGSKILERMKFSQTDDLWATSDLAHVPAM